MAGCCGMVAGRSTRHSGMTQICVALLQHRALDLFPPHSSPPSTTEDLYLAAYWMCVFCKGVSIMKNITKLLLGFSLLAGTTAPGLAADYSPEAPVSSSGFYLRGDAGWSWLDTDVEDNSALTLGGGAGYRFNDNLRTDLRADWAGIGSDDNAFTTVLGNVYFDIPTDTILTPYLGAGAGYGWVESNGIDDHGVAFGLMAGVEVNITGNLSADVGYRYRQILSDDAYDHQALVGLRFGF